MSNSDSEHSSTPSSASVGSLTRLAQEVAAGNSEAESKLFERFFQIVLGLVDQKLGNLPRRVADQEDVALSVMRNMLCGIRDQQFKDLHNREDLWQIVWDLISKRSVDFKRSLTRHKHDFRREIHNCSLDDTGDSSAGDEFVLTTCDDEPDFVLQEVWQHLMAMLDDPELREIGIRKHDGMSSSEIARDLGSTTSRVDFKWKVIRMKWIDELNRQFGISADHE